MSIWTTEYPEDEVWIFELTVFRKPSQKVRGILTFLQQSLQWSLLLRYTLLLCFRQFFKELEKSDLYHRAAVALRTENKTNSSLSSKMWANYFKSIGKDRKNYMERCLMRSGNEWESQTLFWTAHYANHCLVHLPCSCEVFRFLSHTQVDFAQF